MLFSVSELHFEKLATMKFPIPINGVLPHSSPKKSVFSHVNRVLPSILNRDHSVVYIVSNFIKISYNVQITIDPFCCPKGLKKSISVGSGPSVATLMSCGT